jgi:hypothetical protein
MRLGKVEQLSFHSPKLFLAWIGCCLFVNFSFGGGIYGSQVFLCVLLALWVFRNLCSAEGIRLLSVLLLILLFVTWEVMIAGGGNRRFWPELAKVVFLGILSLAITDLFPTEKVPLLLWVVPLQVAVLTVCVFLSGTWDYYDPVLHRFGVPSLGSPNTTAYVLSFCLILLHQQLTNRAKITNRIVILMTYAILAVALIATQSRGGWLIYLAGLFVMSGRKVRIFLLAGAGVGIVITFFTSVGETVSRLNIIMDVRDYGGTGRLFAWQQLAQNLMRHPLSVITGMGPGGIELYIEDSDSSIQSTHSMLAEIVYSYGLIGAVIFLCMLARLWRRTRDNLIEPSVVSLKRALLVALVVSFAFDSYPLTAQILWFTPLLFLILATPIRHSLTAFGSPVTLYLEKKTT